MRPNQQASMYLVTFTEQSRQGILNFLCSVFCAEYFIPAKSRVLLTNAKTYT